MQNLKLSLLSFLPAYLIFYGVWDNGCPPGLGPGILRGFNGGSIPSTPKRLTYGLDYDDVRPIAYLGAANWRLVLMMG